MDSGLPGFCGRGSNHSIATMDHRHSMGDGTVTLGRHAIIHSYNAAPQPNVFSSVIVNRFGRFRFDENFPVHRQGDMVLGILGVGPRLPCSDTSRSHRLRHCVQTNQEERPRRRGNFGSHWAMRGRRMKILMFLGAIVLFLIGCFPATAAAGLVAIKKIRGDKPGGRRKYGVA